MTEAKRQRRKRGSVHLENLPDGTQRLRWTFKGKRQSETYTTVERLKEIEAQLRLGIDPKPSSQLQEVEAVRELLELWLELKSNLVSQETSESYKSVIYPVLRNLPFQDWKDAKQIKNWVIANCPKSMARRFLIYLGAACKSFCDHNPYKGMSGEVKEKWQDNLAPRILNEQETQDGISSIGTPDSVVVRMALLTGMRPAEIYGLKWTDISIGTSSGNIHICRQARETSAGLRIINRLKTQAFRDFPINQELRMFIQYYQGFLRDEEIPCDDWLFCKPDGSPRRYKALAEKWCRHFPAGTTFYNCRDTFITNQLLKGVPASVVAAWVGNSIQIIQKHYADRIELAKVLPR